jgi:hypothetical protein
MSEITEGSSQYSARAAACPIAITREIVNAWQNTTREAVSCSIDGFRYLK